LTDAAVVGRILREYHQAGIEPSGIRRLTGSVRGARVSYWLGEPRGLAVRQRAPALPSSVVHGDPWPGNAIHTAHDQVTLIDWENAGLGLPLLDLGFLFARMPSGCGPDQ
jgi:Phosphotransferase enzyme family